MYLQTSIYDIIRKTDIDKNFGVIVINKFNEKVSKRIFTVLHVIKQEFCSFLYLGTVYIKSWDCCCSFNINYMFYYFIIKHIKILLKSFAVVYMKWWWFTLHVHVCLLYFFSLKSGSLLESFFCRMGFSF